jgi:hypothetical protein
MTKINPNPYESSVVLAATGSGTMHQWSAGQRQCLNPVAGGFVQ